MKSRIIIFAVFLLGTITFLTGCKKEEEELTGRLQVQVRIVETEYIAGAVINISSSIENRDKKIYLQSKTTNSEGIADFGQLDPGTYYCDCYYPKVDKVLYGWAPAEIEKGGFILLSFYLQ